MPRKPSARRRRHAAPSGADRRASRKTPCPGSRGGGPTAEAAAWVDAALVAAEPEAAEEELPVEVTGEASPEAASLAGAAAGGERQGAEVEGAAPTEEAQWQLGRGPPEARLEW